MLQQRGNRVSATRGAAVTAVTTVVAVVGWLVGRVALGHAPEAGGTAVGLVPVAVVAVLAGLAAWVALVGLGRRGASGRRTWRVLALGVGAVSLLGPLTQARGGSVVVLVGLHLVVAIVLVVGLERGDSRPGQ